MEMEKIACSKNSIVYPSIDNPDCSAVVIKIPGFAYKQVFPFKRSLEGIESSEHIEELNCSSCIFLESLPVFTKLRKLDCSQSTLLTDINLLNSGDNITNLDCDECALLYLGPKLHFRCETIERFKYSRHTYWWPYQGVRFRNGVSPRHMNAFKWCKLLYSSELCNHVALEVTRNEKEYAPGGSEYQKLVKKYMHGIVN